jgi:hypothetical protein
MPFSRSLAWPVMAMVSHSEPVAEYLDALSARKRQSAEALFDIRQTDLTEYQDD